MPVGAFPFPMKPKHRKWLRTAADVLVDEYHQDMRSLLEGGDFAKTRMADYLPSRFKRHYDLGFAKQYLDAFLAVTWKLNDKDWWRLNSTAEELAMWAILQQAEALADLDGQRFDPDDLVDYVFEDADFQWLFEGRMDGIEDAPAELEHLGMENLAPSDWFRPFTGKGLFQHQG